MWQLLQMYAGDDVLERAVKNFYEKNKAGVWVCRANGRGFDMAVRLRQGCVMSPWLLNLFMNGVVGEWISKIMNADVCLNEIYGEQLRVRSLLFVEDAVLIADNEECLHGIVSEQGASVCGRRKLKIDVNRSKVMKVYKSGEYGALNVQLNGEKMEELDCVRYLSVAAQ